jgi:hypothetical protein
MRSVDLTAAAPTVFGCSAVVAPPRIAEIKRARIGQRTHGCAAKAANDGTCARIAGEGANGCTRARTQKAARGRAISWCRSAGGQS